QVDIGVGVGQGHYRRPCSCERHSFLNDRARREGDAYVDNSVGARLEAGKAIITGVRDGDFERRVGDGYLGISTDPESGVYYPVWMEWMADNAADLLLVLAVRVFESSIGPARMKDAGKQLAKP
ncbi:MAG: hypothetical protein PF495_13625, partial [Spirochaetales bacterium]|nr:hypothetical protein [Spirochaetales bacterium]